MQTTPLVRPPDGFILDTEPEPNPVRTYLGELDSEESQRTMAGCLGRIASLMIVKPEDEPGPPLSHLAWWLLRFEHTSELRTAFKDQTTPRGEPWSPAYVNKHLVCLRRILKTCRRHRLITADDYETATDLKKITGTREPAGRSVANSEIAQVLNTCLADDSPAGVRDAAIITLMHSTGVRRAEIAAARRSNYDPARRTLQIIGKGNKQRTVYLHARAGEWMNAWLAHVPPGAGPLFCPVHWSGKLQPRAMTPPAIEGILTKRCREAKVAEFNPHDLRRTFISNFLDSGGDLPLAQRQAGHSDVSTTARYDRRDDLKLQEAVERLWLPSPTDLRDAEPQEASET